MPDHIDQLLRCLADEPLPARLDQLEDEVMRRIALASLQTTVAPHWRFAAVGIALVVGLGVGGSSAVPWNGSLGHFSDSVADANLAPSSLLAAS